MKVTLRVMAAVSVGGVVEVEFPDGAPPTVAAVLDALVARRPGLGPVIRDGRGELQPFVNVFVGQDNVKRLGGLSVTVPPDTEVWVIPPGAGG
jgi:molybdopterin converting factor small subunit